MTPIYDLQEAKRPVNLTMNGDLVEKARPKGLNLSALAEKSGRGRTRSQRTGAVGCRDCRGMRRARALFGGIRLCQRPASRPSEGRAGTRWPLNNPRRYGIVRDRVRGMKAPYLIVLHRQDVPSITRIIAPLTLPQRGDHDGLAPLVEVDGTIYRSRLLDPAAYPCSVMLETVAPAAPSANAIVPALDVIFGGYSVGLSH